MSGESRAVRAPNDPLGVCRSEGGRLLELASGRAASGQSRAGFLSLVWCAEWCPTTNGVQVGGGGSGALGEGRVREGARCVV